MKHYKYLIFILFGLMLFSGCKKEAMLNTELETFERQYDINSKDPVFKYVSEYFFKYDNQFIVDPVIGDFKYNFDRTYDIEIDQIDQEESNVLAAIALTEELFLDRFSDDFKIKHFPLSVIIADSIRSERNPFTGGFVKKPLYYAGRYFFAFLVNDEIMAYTQEEKDEYSTLLFGAMIGESHSNFGFPDEFYKSGEAYYGDNAGKIYNLPFKTEEEIKAEGDVIIAKGLGNGFILLNIDNSSSRIRSYKYPSIVEDVANIVKYIVTTPEAERKEFFAANPAVSLKADLLIKTLKANGLDLIEIASKL